MKTNLEPGHVFRNTFFTLLLFGLSFTLYGQCPTITDPNPTICIEGAGFNFSNLNSYAIDGGNGIVWYDAPTGGNAYLSNQLVSEGTYYAGDNTGTCGTRNAITVNFTVDPSGQNLDRIYCSNENATVQTYIDDVLQSSIPSGGSVEVYNDFSLTDQAAPTDDIPTGGTTYFIVFVDNGGCKSQLEIGQVGVFTAPEDPTPPLLQTFCADINPTVGDLVTGTLATNYNWYDSLDFSGDPILPALSLLTPLTNGNTYYIQVDEPFCDSNPIAVTVTIDIPSDSGTSGSLDYCNTSLPSPFDLFDELGGAPDTTGTWSGPLGTANGHLGTVDISTLTTAGTYTFTYTVSGNGVCPDVSATVSITIYETFSSGTPSTANPASFCESGLPSDFDLFTLIENHDINGQWTEGSLSTDPVVASTVDLTSLTSGTYFYTYTQNILPNSCPEASTTVQINILADPNAGNAVNQFFCENDLVAHSPFDLFDALDNSQDNNLGSWTDSANTVISNVLDITNFTVAGSPYLFNYTIDNGACTDTEQITITIEPAPESGTVNAPAEFCEGAAPNNYDLFNLLEGEDQTGTWYIGTDNTGSTTPNQVDLSALTSGTYDYTFDVDNINSCDDELVTVQVIINPLPNTGTPTPAIFCENDPVLNNTAFDLFTLLTGTVDAGGTWTDDSSPATGTLTGNTINLTGLSIGVFNFTYSITDANGCTNSSTVLVRIDDAPESGTVNTPAEFCEGTAPNNYDLFDLLEGEDQTGTWYIGTDNTGSTTPNQVDLSALISGTYDYTFDVDNINSCDDELVTVQVIINPLPNTGTPTPAIFCENDPALSNTTFDLFTLLTGTVDAGGTWTDDSSPATGALTGNTINLTGLSIGTFNFTYSITDANGCTNSSTVLVRIDDAPESGTVNAPAEFCIADITVGQSYDLFELLEGEDQVGSWSDDDNTMALTGNTVILDGLTSGTYNFTYNVDAIGTCDDVDVTVSIVINDTPVPTAAAIQEFCDAATVADLTATGTAIQWYDAVNGGNLLAATDALVDGQVYYATQTMGCESSARAAVTVTIYQSPDAGNLNTTPITACNNGTVNLFDGLDGSEDNTGTWYEGTDNTGTVVGNPTAYDVSGLSAGTYQFTYEVTASAPCLDDSTSITITIDEPLNAGTDNTLDVCSNNGTTDLFTLIGPADTGGVWSPALDSGTGVFDPLIDLGGTYTYTVTNACGVDTSEVVVTVTQAPDAGTDNSLSICVGDMSTDLFDLLGTTAQSGGVWSPVLSSGTGVFDPTVDVSGVYIYTVTAISPCVLDATAEVTVTVNDSPAIIVLEPNPEFCQSDNPTVASLSASIRPIGTVNWYEDMALTLPLSDGDSLIDGEDYYATQTNSTGCESSVPVQINVTVNDVSTPTWNDPSVTYCINDNPTINDLTLNITEYNVATNNVIWYDSAIGGTIISEGTALEATTYYAVLIDETTGCESSVRLEVTPNVTACGKLSMPDGFSPNGDGVNDTFEIDNLSLIYPNFEIEIYNRYGNMVYRGNANSPSFDGTSNKSSGIAKGDLPVGVYFYIFNFNDGENKPEQGRLYLSR
ncbi:gliding motility-associated C-terminal domain-containing protein [Tamlana sp. 2201CG12-4]|uniref:Ig-like domain-containing protein n=1 Tax=Tamlana sp. 2201CG12-4 TaxID=3112582 RepID=UPI002DBE2565|nr:gliding motility-associated C-terminal domain-containing protein [Tamlana sp. 2201CG12-4]MEC3905816.1 gliding motility-associated C-terminal domain-containing protein [Tamlana sp. 2201CG12-4]